MANKNKDQIMVGFKPSGDAVLTVRQGMDKAAESFSTASFAVGIIYHKHGANTHTVYGRNADEALDALHSELFSDFCEVYWYELGNTCLAEYPTAEAAVKGEGGPAGAARYYFQHHPEDSLVCNIDGVYCAEWDSAELRQISELDFNLAEVLADLGVRPDSKGAEMFIRLLGHGLRLDSNHPSGAEARSVLHTMLKTAGVV